jgi:hypothetical protein
MSLIGTQRQIAGAVDVGPHLGVKLKQRGCGRQGGQESAHCEGLRMPAMTDAATPTASRRRQPARERTRGRLGTLRCRERYGELGGRDGLLGERRGRGVGQKPAWARISCAGDRNWMLEGAREGVKRGINLRCRDCIGASAMAAGGGPAVEMSNIVVA